MKVIKQIDVWSLALVLGGIFFVFGLVLGVLQWFLLLIFGARLEELGLIINEPVQSPAILAAVSGFISFVLFAAVLGIVGFLGGALAAVVYNFISRRIGGLKLELTQAEDQK